jgi:hypothetical protein
MNELSRQNLRKVYRELDEVGVAIGVVGTRRQKLMELARMVVPITDALVGTRPEVKRVRDDLVRLTHNVRRAQTKARLASKAVAALAAQVKVAEKLVDKGLGDVPEAFNPIDGMSILNTWGCTEREARAFLRRLEDATSVLDKMGLMRGLGDTRVSLDPEGSPRDSMTYDLFNDMFIANPMYARARERGISDALGGRLWVKLFKQREVEVWGGASQAWDAFSEAFFDLIRGKGMKGRDAARMATSLGRIIGPENWRKVA